MLTTSQSTVRASFQTRKHKTCVARTSPSCHFVSRALTVALATLGQGPAFAAALIFDAGPQTITTNEVADDSFWVGVTNPNVGVAIAGSGSVTVPGGGNSAALGVNATSSGNSLDIGGTDARLIAAEDLYVGYAGASNTLNVTSGGTVQVRFTNIGADASSSGNAVNVSGTGSLSATANIQLGIAGGANTLTLSTGGAATNAGDAVIGLQAGSQGNAANVTGAGSSWTSGAVFYLGYAGSSNALVLSGGGAVASLAGDFLVGAEPGANSNTATVTGAGSLLDNTGRTLYVGRSGSNNSLSILAGGDVLSQNARIGGGTNASGNVAGNTVTVDGAGSTWTIGGTLRVGSGVSGGSDSDNLMAVRNGGSVTVAGNSFVGYSATSLDNRLTVGDSGSVLNLQALTIGRLAGGTGNLATVATGGTLSATSVTIGESSGLVIGEGSVPGSVTTPTITGSLPGAFIRFNHAANSLDFAPTLSGTLAVVHDGTGLTTLTGAASSFGAITVNGGTLVLGTLTSTAATVNTGGTLAISSGATASVSGNYNQVGSAVFRTHIADDTTFGRLNVAGDVTLPANARFDARVQNCAAIAPGTTLIGVMSAGSPIIANTIAVTDNCPGLSFTASLGSNGQTIDLTANLSATAIPTLSQWALIGLAMLVAGAGLFGRPRMR